jgi:Asp-tRNA(Asn)/Glu-tRNA(Gln) amidotransferase A subunit family amidase
LQIITPRLQEQKLFEIAHIFEQNNGIWIKNAPGFE